MLFPNHDNGMRLYKELKNLGVRATIAPTPRAASKCCGISLLVEEKDLDVIRECIAEHEIEICLLYTSSRMYSIWKDVRSIRIFYFDLSVGHDGGVC